MRGSGTARYLARHSLWRSLGTALGGLLKVTGLLLLALVFAAIWLIMRHPLVAMILVAVWLWRRARRRHVVPPTSERERLRLEILRLRVLVGRLQVGPDVIAADRDYRAGRISQHDLDTALAVAAEARRYQPQFRFQQ